MTLQQFIEKWNGKYCEVAGSANAQNQCVDLSNAYIRDVLGLPIIEWTNAKDFPSKAGDAYEYIKNTPSGVPKEGDLIIWGGTTAGHIAIFIEGNADSFRSFDQNYPTGTPCHVQNHNYDTPPVLGWLHPKHTVSVDEVCMPKTQADDFNRVKEGWNQIRTLLNVEDSVMVVASEVKKLVGYEDKVIQSEKQLTDTQTELNMVKGQLLEEQEKNKKQAEEAAELTQRATDLEVKYQMSTSNYEKAMQKVGELEKQITNGETGWTLILKGIQKLLGR